MDLETARQHQVGSLHWTKISAMICFFIAGAVLAGSLMPSTPTQRGTAAAVTTDFRH